MRLSYLIPFCFLLFFKPLTAQNLDYSGPVSAALGGIKVFDNTPWAGTGNVANLAKVNSYAVGISYQRRFNMDELSSRVAVMALPTRFGTLAGLVLQNGYSKSNYNRFGLSYSRNFGDKVMAGMQFNYLSHQMISTADVTGFYSSLGINFRASDKFDVGVFIQNPEQAKLKYPEVDYALPSFFNTAVKYSPSAHVLLMVELEKQQSYDLVSKFGIQLSFKNKLFIRSGIKAQAVEFTFGGGFKAGGLSIDVGFLQHQQLGLTSSAGLYYSFNGKKH